MGIFSSVRLLFAPNATCVEAADAAAAAGVVVGRTNLRLCGRKKVPYFLAV